MATATELRAQLRAQMRRKRLVRFDKRFASYATTAYVASVGADLVMFLLIDDRIRFDGFQILRIRDLRGLREEPRAEFVETVLRRRRLRRPATPRIRLGCFGDALRSASRQFPLVAIHRERADPDVCHIGAVVEVQEHRVVLREVDRLEAAAARARRGRGYGGPRALRERAVLPAVRGAGTHDRSRLPE